MSEGEDRNKTWTILTPVDPAVVDNVEVFPTDLDKTSLFTHNSEELDEKNYPSEETYNSPKNEGQYYETTKEISSSKIGKKYNLLMPKGGQPNTNETRKKLPYLSLLNTKSGQKFNPSMLKEVCNKTYQGPFVRPMTCKQLGTTFYHYTVFTHPEDQDCYVWIPDQTGYRVSRKVDESDNLLFGPASIKEGSLLYSCQLNKCRIPCGCSVCLNPTKCSPACKEFPCETCDIQCQEHAKILLQRTFDEKKDQYTIMTNDETFQKEANIEIQKYPGIPIECEICTENIKEHENIHLIPHFQCKFCRLNRENLENNKTIKQFEENMRSILHEEESTCFQSVLLFFKSHTTGRYMKIKYITKLLLLPVISVEKNSLLRVT